MINKGDIAVMVKTEDWLMPMKIDSEYIVKDIQYGVATILSTDNKEYHISTKVLEEYFVKFEEPKCEECCDECCDDEDYDHILNIMDNSEYTAFKIFDKCVVVACKLPNGFVIVESSACVDPDDYNESIAIENCLDRIENKIITMEAYKRCDEMCEDEDCVYNDLDCDDCEASDSCPYCANNN